jgi:hypothetical protein
MGLRDLLQDQGVATTDPREVSYSGGCHCGAISLRFLSARPLAPRACGCSFCRKHGARSVSDPDGFALISWSPDRPPIHYRFGLGSADFLICAICGVYVAAVVEIGGDLHSVLNLSTFDEPRLDLAGTPMDYEGERVEDRTERRRRVWTPTELQAKGRNP